MTQPDAGGATAPTAARRPPELIAALVNGALIVALPLLWTAHVSFTNTTVMRSRLMKRP